MFVMTERARIKIAALVTTLFLGAVSTAGVLTHTPTPTVSATSPAQIATPGNPTRAAAPSPTSEHETHD
jgi:hypothetical protein